MLISVIDFGKSLLLLVMNRRARSGRIDQCVGIKCIHGWDLAACAGSSYSGYERLGTFDRETRKVGLLTLGEGIVNDY